MHGELMSVDLLRFLDRAGHVNFMHVQWIVIAVRFLVCEFQIVIFVVAHV